MCYVMSIGCFPRFDIGVPNPLDISITSGILIASLEERGVSWLNRNDLI